MNGIHPAAQQGFTRETQAYVNGRPDYPSELLVWLRDEMGLAAGQVVLDLGAGTGKFSQLLLQTGAEVWALEPVEAMRAQLQARLPEVRALAGTAAAIPLPDGSVDVLICAQSFHWFATEEALAEMHRVLKPGGRLGLVWNVRNEALDWVRSITAIITPFEGDAPRFYKGDWRHVLQSSPWFGAPTRTDFDYLHIGSPQDVIVQRILSVSFIAALAPAQKAAVQASLQELIAGHPALRAQTSVAFPYQTQAYACRRLTPDEAQAPT